MKVLYLSAFLAILGTILVACYQNVTPTVDMDATVQAAVKATLAARPTDTPLPDLEATMVAAVEATLAAQPTAYLAEASDRPYRTYPRPTGYPGFRRYYQKRCYPGCHVPPAPGTPTPEVAPVHP